MTENLQNYTAEIDPNGQLDRHLLSLPTSGCQATLTGDIFGGHFRLQAAGSDQNRAVWQKLEDELRGVCGQVVVPIGKGVLFWGGLSATVFITATAMLALRFNELKVAFLDCWF